MKKLIRKSKRLQNSCLVKDKNASSSSVLGHSKKITTSNLMTTNPHSSCYMNNQEMYKLGYNTNNNSNETISNSNNNNINNSQNKYKYPQYNNLYQIQQQEQENNLNEESFIVNHYNGKEEESSYYYYYFNSNSNKLSPESSFRKNNSNWSQELKKSNNLNYQNSDEPELSFVKNSNNNDRTNIKERFYSSSTSLKNFSRVKSYSYYFFVILFIILILFLHISPSHEQYFNSNSRHISRSSNSDEWDSTSIISHSSSSNNNNNRNNFQASSSSALTASSSGFGGGGGGGVGSISTSSSYGHGYNCVNIPVNFTLCKNIGYSKMMVPNLLGHDSLQEAEYHAKAWVPLLGLQCHPDTQLFLCSLFTPICLDRPIYPCRSLCQVVQAKCEPRMLIYKYPWPSMLKCDQFPEDHDLCIRPGAANTEEKIDEPDCPSCHQAHTCENIVDNYCRATFVFRAKFKRSHGSTMEFRKGRWFKPPQESGSGGRRNRPEFRSFDLEPKDNCCNNQLTPGVPYIVMGISKGDQRVVTFVMPWNGKDKILKNAVRTFRSMDCSNPLPMSVMAVGEEESRANNNNNNKTLKANNNGNTNNNNNSNGRRRQRRRKDGQVQAHNHNNNNNGNNGNHRRGRQYGGCRVTMTSDSRNQ